MRFLDYTTDQFHDELFEDDGRPRPYAAQLVQLINDLPPGDLVRHQRAADLSLLSMGITFTVYGADEGTERIFPFDIVPRVVSAHDWDVVDRGLRQRIEALNLFIDDVYHKKQIVRDGVIPADLVHSSLGYLPQCADFNPPRSVWCHITGTDLVRDSGGTFFVLEDNLRCPSGVSYVLENRKVLKQTFPALFAAMHVRPVYDYPNRLLAMLESLAPEAISTPNVALLTPGVFNSAYFEHSFLAQQMGIELVEGRDLVVVDGQVMMRTIRGFQRVDVLYRRIDDAFLDPRVFRPESMLGVPGLMEAYKAGRVALANAPGTGIADDKAIYAYVPQIVKYYLGQDIIVPNVETYVCWEEKQRKHVLANIDKLVVKAVNQSGGYGMLIGPHASQADREHFARLVEEHPREYIAQPTLDLSRAPVIVDDHFEGRHVDLRPYVLYGENIFVLPGGLTRVALRKGKDTWVLSNDKRS